jgi:hypothetical protein
MMDPVRVLSMMLSTMAATPGRDQSAATGQRQAAWPSVVWCSSIAAPDRPCRRAQFGRIAAVTAAPMAKTSGVPRHTVVSQERFMIPPLVAF